MLAAVGLSRRFGNRVAVDALDIEVRTGEIFGLLGPNGAGKTTTLRMLGALIPPTSGEVQVNGVRLEAASAGAYRRRLGFLPETPGLWEALTVIQNLAVYGQLFDVRDVPGAVRKALVRFDLWDRRDDRVAVLSKGMRQKLALARALLHDPTVVLLDEPTANLDPSAAREVRDLLVELKAKGCAVVVSTHNLDEIERVADRVALISTRLVALGQPAQLRRQLFGHRVRIRLADEIEPGLIDALEALGAAEVELNGTWLSARVTEPDHQIPAIVRTLVNAGAAVREVAEENPPLEEVYLRLIGGSNP